MYRSFYGLKNKPFTLKPDGECVYLSDTHEEAIANLHYGVSAEKGFLMLTGGVGTGKTTVLNALLTKLDNNVHVCLINNPTLEAHEFYHYAAGLLGLNTVTNKGEFIIRFLELLDRCARKDEKILLIIDEAQSVSVDLMDEVRLLSNHAGTRNVLGIFFVGQPELSELLAHQRLLPLKQRIELRYHLSDLTREDTSRYIIYRLNHAGAADTSIFTDEAIDGIHQATGGNPRLINVLCDRALIAGYFGEIQKIGSAVIAECVHEIHMLEPPAALHADKTGSVEPDSVPTDVINAETPNHLLRNTAFTLLILAFLGSALYLSFHKGLLPGAAPSSTIKIGTLQVR